ncbi:MAG: winged helix-turn-helix domain-containing protein [Pigmentiphaga sp.]
MNDYFNASSDIAVLLHNTEKDYPVAERLLAVGHTVYICGSHHELVSLYQQGKRPLVLAHLDYALPLTDNVLQSLLHTARPLDADVLHQLGLQATAYASLAEELTARSALYTPSPEDALPSSSDAAWILAPGVRRMTLQAPDGSVIRLTPTEARFVHALFSAPDFTVEREHWQNQNEQDGPRDIHNLAVIVSRLRQKVHSRGQVLPLRVLRGAGYFFAGKCRIDS